MTKPKITRSKTYKSGNYRVKAVLKDGAVEVTIKLANLEWEHSPLRIPVSEWVERRTANPDYDKWHYLDSRYNKSGAPNVNIFLDAVRKAADEVTGDYVQPPQTGSGKPLPGGKRPPQGFKVFKLTAPSGEARTPLETLYEVMLHSGLPISAPIETFTLGGIEFHALGDLFAVIVCLETKLNQDIIRAMAVLQPQWVVCRSAAFIGNDDLKNFAVQTFEGIGAKGFVRV
jgi:hypothetical protein